MGKSRSNRDSGVSQGSSSGHGDVFDVRKIRRLVELMNEHELGEIDLRQGDQRIRIRRGSEPIAPMAGVPQAVTLQQTAGSSTGESDSSKASADTEQANVAYVKSPMVGTFYVAPSPDAPPFVQVGDVVGPESKVCIVEAMKVFNEIPAECSGKIVAALVENGEPVEFGQPLFKVDTSL